jgi:hypothetical protein
VALASQVQLCKRSNCMRLSCVGCLARQGRSRVLECWTPNLGLHVQLRSRRERPVCPVASRRAPLRPRVALFEARFGSAVQAFSLRVTPRHSCGEGRPTRRGCKTRREDVPQSKRRRFSSSRRLSSSRTTQFSCQVGLARRAEGHPNLKGRAGTLWRSRPAADCGDLASSRDRAKKPLLLTLDVPPSNSLLSGRAARREIGRDVFDDHTFEGQGQNLSHCCRRCHSI